MAKQISGEELLLAIGNIDPKLLDYPSKPRTRAILFKKLTLAACAVLCISVVLSVFLDMSLTKGKMDMEANDSPSGDFAGAMGNDSGDGGAGPSYSVNSAPDKIILNAFGEVQNAVYENNSLLLFLNSDGKIEIELEKSNLLNQETNVYIKYSESGLPEEVSEAEPSNERAATYIFTPGESMIIEFKNTASPDFTIFIEKSDDLFVYYIEYGSEDSES